MWHTTGFDYKPLDVNFLGANKLQETVTRSYT